MNTLLSLFPEIAPGIRTEPDQTGTGIFLAVPGVPHRANWMTHRLGPVPEAGRFVALTQKNNFWVIPTAGPSLDRLGDKGAVFLLTELRDGSFLVLVALPSETESHAVFWWNGGLDIIADNGDATMPLKGGTALFVARGASPEKLLADAARAVEKKLPAARLRERKALPPHIDRFGWCTWNAFYQAVSADKVVEGLVAFRKAGQRLGFLIVDDGWQDEAKPANFTRLLAGVETNGKFPGGFAPLVRTAKEEFGVHDFLVWHTAYGVPAGPVPGGEKTKAYKSVVTPALHSPLYDDRFVFFWLDPATAVPSRAGLARMYRDMHDWLVSQGVDGVKVDYQGVVSMTANGHGGRVAAVDAMRSALETSCTRHFGDMWLSCMAHQPEVWYHARHNNLSRGSDDFFPNDPGSHGIHVRTNAIVGLWFGRFMGIDWDMFCSKHPFGAYHAAARALSGGPVYTADEPAAIDPAVIRRAAFPDGTVPRFPAPAVPSRESIFWDPEGAKGSGDLPPKAFVVVNRGFVRHAGTAVPVGAAGVFDLDTGAAPFPNGGAQAFVGPSDIGGLPARRYAAWKHNARELTLLGRDETVSVRTGDARFEVVTFAPIIRDAYAVFGIVSMDSAAVTVRSIEETDDGLAVELLGGGEFAAAFMDKPSALHADGKKVPFSYSEESGLLLATLPEGTHALSIAF